MTTSMVFRLAVVALVSVAGIAAGVGASSAATGAPRAAEAAKALSAERAAAKPCRTVVRRVKGKRRRVRVCRRRPAPKVQNVALALDGGRAASATIGAAGGTVTATASAGAVLTLSIPPGAVDTDTKITATPVTSLGRVPAGVRVVGAVQLAPDGLALARPATLTIELPAAARAVTGFAWFEDGADAHRYPLSRAGARLTLQIVHFSGAGAFTGPTNWLAAAETALTVRFARTVRPLMRAAETDDTQLAQSLDAAIGWQRQVELLGLRTRFATWWAEIEAWVPRALANAVERASAKCASHDLTQLARLLALERLVQSLGISLPGAGALQRYLECARFELDLEYHQTARLHMITASEEHTIESDLSVKSTIPIAMTSTLEGAGPLEVTGWHYLETIVSRQADPPFSCTSTAIAASPATNMQVALVIDPTGAGFPEITLTLTPGAVSLTRSNCFDPSRPASGSTDVPPPFAGDRGVPGTTRYAVSFSAPHGSFVGSDVYATYGPEVVSGTAPGGMHYSMTRRFVLRHVPQR